MDVALRTARFEGLVNQRVRMSCPNGAATAAELGKRFALRLEAAVDVIEHTDGCCVVSVATSTAAAMPSTIVREPYDGIVREHHDRRCWKPR